MTVDARRRALCTTSCVDPPEAELAITTFDHSALAHGTLPLKTSAVPLRPILGWAVDAAGATNGDVVVDCDPLLHATVDPDRLEQIVTNLVVNALAHGSAPVRVTAAAARRASRAEVVIRDHGAGVAPSDVPHLFERFSRLAVRRSESTGLGLSISRGLARAMGGDLAYTAAQPGSCFTLTLMGA
jgi:signal transduction histidine kinase